MKDVNIISKVVGKDVKSTSVSSVGSPSVDLSNYLPKPTWDKVFELKVDDTGTQFLFGKLPIVTKYGVSIYGDENAFEPPSLMDAIVVDNITIIKQDGKLVALGGGGGVADSVAWSNITGKPDFATVATSGKYSDLSGLPTIPTIPSSLKNPYSLTFGSKTYDGSSAKTIVASDLGALTSHQSIYALTIKNSAGTTQLTYTPNIGAGSITLTKAMVGLGNVENTALSTWVGTNKITTLGTITSGTWNGTKIANSYLANSSVTISGTSVSLGGSITQAALRTALGLGSNAYTSTEYLPSSSYTASDILSKIKSVDGSGSGLDADLLDGYDSEKYYRESRGYFDSTELETFTKRASGGYVIRYPNHTGLLVSLKGIDSGSCSSIELIAPHYNINGQQGLQVRYTIDGKSYGPTKTFAFLDSNVASATKATQDGNGNVISSTYVSALGVSGDNLTWVKNGATNSLTIPYATTAKQLTNWKLITIIKNTTGAESVYKLIADLSNWVPEKTGNWGLIGIMYGRRPGNANGTVVQKIVAFCTAWGSGTNYKLFTDDPEFVRPCIVSYNGVTYLALEISGSGSARAHYFLGSQDSLLEEFIEIPTSSATVVHDMKTKSLNGVNALSATKLQKPRTLWGQSFDGMADVNGPIVMNNSTFISMKDTGGADRVVLNFDGLNRLFVGNGTSSAGYNTYINGNNIYLRYGTSPTTGLLLNSSGNITIGAGDKAYTNYKLYVDGNVRITNTLTTVGDIYKYNSDSSYRLTFVHVGNEARIYNVAENQSGHGTLLIGSTNVTKTLCYKDGNWGVGTTSPSAKLHVEGDILTTGGLTMLSARKLKNVTDERGLSLEELSVIKPTRFTWKDGRDDKIHIGGIADDVMKVLPEVIYKTADDTLTMDYGNAAFAIAASLIKPVINHEERIKMLEEENKRLKEEIEILKWNIA